MYSQWEKLLLMLRDIGEEEQEGDGGGGGGGGAESVESDPHPDSQ